MKLRPLAINAQELEEGPFVFLLSHSEPVAYEDRRPEAATPGLYSTDRRFNKSVTRHLNAWLRRKARPYAVIPHDQIVAAFEGIGLYSSGGVAPPPPPAAFAEVLGYLADLARQGSAR